MNKIDLERFVQGVEEINRKKKIILLVIDIIETLLDKKGISRKWKYQGNILKISIGQPLFPLFFSIRAPKSTLICEIRKEEKGDDYLRWRKINPESSIPAWAVPLVYDHLPEILTKIEEKIPEAEIFSYFEFFSRQAADT